MAARILTSLAFVIEFVVEAAAVHLRADGGQRMSMEWHRMRVFVGIGCGLRR